MILSTNAYNWAMLRSGLSMGDFAATLTLEREMELFKQYNEWRRSKGLTEETAPAATAPSSVPETPKDPKPMPKPPVDDLSALINEVAAEVEAEEAAEEALIQDALDGADEIVGTAPVPADIEEEIEADEPVADEPVPDDDALMDTEVVDEPEVATTTDGAAEPVAAAPEVATISVVAAAPDKPAAQSVDFSAVIRSLPKEADPALYSRIVTQYGPKTLTMAQAALKEATAKHRATAAIRAFLGWLNDV